MKNSPFALFQGASLILLFTGAVVAKEPAPAPPAAGGDFAKELKSLDKILSPELRMARVDGWINQYFTEKRLSRQNVYDLIERRKLECAKQPEKCLNFSKWRGSVCTPGAGADPVVGDLFNSLYQLVRTPALAKGLISELQKCGPAASREQLIVAGEALTALQSQGLHSSAAEVVSWMNQSMQKSSMPLARKLEIATAVSDDLGGRPPAQVYAAATALLTPLKSMDSAALKGLVADHKLQLDEWFGRVFTVLVVGKVGELRKLIEANPKVWEGMQKLDRKIALAEALCLDWIQTGAPLLCERRLAELEVEVKGQASGLRWQHARARARAAYLGGDSEKAVALTLAVLKEAGAAGDKNGVGWSNFSLSQYYSAEKQSAEVTKHLAQFRRAAAEMNLGWLNVFAMTRDQSVALDQGNCPAAISAGEKARTFLQKSVAGVIGEMAWINYFDTLCYALLKDTRNARKRSEELAEQVKLMPGWKFQKDLADVAVAAMAGKSTDAAMSVVRKSIGAKHPEVLRTERILARMKGR